MPYVEAVPLMEEHAWTGNEDFVDRGPCQLRPVRQPSLYRPYVYKPGEIRHIAENYADFLQLPVDNPMLDAKCDFDMALNALGTGHWKGDLDEEFIRTDFERFRYYGFLQKIVIGVIIGVDDTDSWYLSIEDRYREQGKAYRKMARFLNEGQT